MEVEGEEGRIVIKSVERSGVRIPKGKGEGEGVEVCSIKDLTPPTFFSICSQFLRLIQDPSPSSTTTTTTAVVNNNNIQTRSAPPTQPYALGDQHQHLGEDEEDDYYYYMMYTSSSMPDRLTICSHLASTVSSLGFTPNITFRTFLYPTEEDYKKLLRFFVKKLSELPQQPNKQLPAHKRVIPDLGDTSSNNQAVEPANDRPELNAEGSGTTSQDPKFISDLPESSNSRSQDSSNEEASYSKGPEGLKKLKRLKEFEQEIEAVLSETNIREEELCKLSADLQNQSKAAPSRRSYIQRISEIAKNSRKQDTDIERILKDTRDLQLESNYIQERLNRTFAVVDETVFREGKKDPVGRQAYRLLTSIHESFDQISDKILRTDRMRREAAEYEAKLLALSRRSFNVEKLQADLDAIRRENELLERGDDNVDPRIL